MAFLGLVCMMISAISMFMVIWGVEPQFLVMSIMMLSAVSTYVCFSVADRR